MIIKYKIITIIMIKYDNIISKIHDVIRKLEFDLKMKSIDAIGNNSKWLNKCLIIPRKLFDSILNVNMIS